MGAPRCLLLDTPVHVSTGGIAGLLGDPRNPSTRLTRKGENGLPALLASSSSCVMLGKCLCFSEPRMLPPADGE